LAAMAALESFTTCSI